MDSDPGSDPDLNLDPNLDPSSRPRALIRIDASGPLFGIFHQFSVARHYKSKFRLRVSW